MPWLILFTVQLDAEVLCAVWRLSASLPARQLLFKILFDRLAVECLAQAAPHCTPSMQDVRQLYHLLVTLADNVRCIRPHVFV